MEIVIAPDEVKVTAVVSSEEVLVASAFGAEKDDSPADKVRHHAEYLLAHVRIWVDGRLLQGRVVATRGELGGRPEYELEYGPIAGTPRRVNVEEDVLREIEFAPGNQWEATYLTRVHLAGQSGTRRFLLTCKSPLDIDCITSMNKAGGSYQETVAFAAAFVRHGIAHILTGYDHLLFVAALLLAVTTLWDLVKVISAFTLAHTITLALAALDVFRLPGRIVEPMIAASIMFVALQNIFWPERSRGWSRLAVAFGFGLFHGLGFAGGLLGAMSDARGGGQPWRSSPLVSASRSVTRWWCCRCLGRCGCFVPRVTERRGMTGSCNASARRESRLPGPFILSRPCVSRPGGENGQDWIRTSEGVSQRIYSPPRLATSVPTRSPRNSER
jgi:hypothetical protein